MKYLDRVAAEPLRHHFYSVLRTLERNELGKPRIGDSLTVQDDIVVPSQEPYTAFPASDITGVDRTSSGIPRLSVRFLGMFGPQGPLPLTVTENAYIWSTRDPSFRHFVDIFSTRFLQLFYRAWADSRRIAQFERPDADRFRVFLGSFAGVGTPAMTHPDEGAQIARVAFAGLVNGHVKSVARLEQLLHGVLGLDAVVVEWIGTWLPLDKSELTSLGGAAARLGSDCIVGQRVHSITERFRIRIKCDSLEEYDSLLPGTPKSNYLANLVFFYVGYRYDFDLELGLRRSLAPRAQLGKAGKLGLTAWIKGEDGSEDDEYVYEARFDPLARQEQQSSPRNGRK